MMTAAAYDNARRWQQPMRTAVVAYNNGRRRQHPTMVAAAAYINDSRGGVIAWDRGCMHRRRRDKGAHRGIRKGDQGVKKGGLRHNGQNNIYSHVEISGARWGAFFGFSRPTLHQFSQIFVSDRFWRTAGAFSKMAIVFKLQAGVSLVSSTPPPRPHRDRAMPGSHPKSTV